MQLDTQSTNPPRTSHGDPTGKTKETITSFLGRDGEADTTVHEIINPAVVKEHIQRANHEEQQKIVDREVHQDHYHTSVQPVRDQEIQPETHEHNIAGVETHEIKHGNEQHVAERLAAERNQFHDTREIEETQTTVSTEPTVAGEHIHHHVHETIQPVLEKDIVQPHVIHTTYPIHEVHVNEAKHHTASTLPEVTLAEFQRQGGTLAGREERVDSFSGAPHSIDDSVTGSHHSRDLGGPGAAGTTTVTSKNRGTQEKVYDTTHHGQYDTTGPTKHGYDTTVPSKSQRAAAGGAGAVGLGGVGAGAGVGAGTGGGGAGSAANTAASKIPGMNKLTKQSSKGEETSGGHGGGQGYQGKKPSLIDKLNPMKDTGNQGKTGFMT